MGSARSNRSQFSSRQKYWERKSSWTQTICAPRPAASRMRALGLGEILVGVRRAGHLDQADAKLGSVHDYYCRLAHPTALVEVIRLVFSISTAPWSGARVRTIARRWCSGITAGHGDRDHDRRHPGAGHARPGHSDGDDAAGGRARRRRSARRCRRSSGKPERYYLRVCPPLDDKHCPGVEAVLRAVDAARRPARAGDGESDADRLAEAGPRRPARLLPFRRIRRDGEDPRRAGEAGDPARRGRKAGSSGTRRFR